MMLEKIVAYRTSMLGNGEMPMEIELSENEISHLNQEMRRAIDERRATDESVRLRPDLMPAKPKHVDVTYGDSIFGMKIVRRWSGQTC